jgi:hypothetical protein
VVKAEKWLPNSLPSGKQKIDIVFFFPSEDKERAEEEQKIGR